MSNDDICFIFQALNITGLSYVIVKGIQIGFGFNISQNTMQTDSPFYTESGSGSGYGSGDVTDTVIQPLTTPSLTTFPITNTPLTTVPISTIPLTTFTKADCNIRYDTLAYTEEEVSPLMFEDISIDACCDRCASMSTECSVFLYMSTDAICLVFEAVNITGLSYEKCEGIHIGFRLSNSDKTMITNSLLYTESGNGEFSGSGEGSAYDVL
jgi:hypothetical protein